MLLRQVQVPSNDLYQCGFKVVSTFVRSARCPTSVKEALNASVQLDVDVPLVQHPQHCWLAASPDVVVRNTAGKPIAAYKISSSSRSARHVGRELSIVGSKEWLQCSVHCCVLGIPFLLRVVLPPACFKEPGLCSSHGSSHKLVHLFFYDRARFEAEFLPRLRTFVCNDLLRRILSLDENVHMKAVRAFRAIVVQFDLVTPRPCLDFDALAVSIARLRPPPAQAAPRPRDAEHTLLVRELRASVQESSIR